MTALLYLIPISIGLGGLALAAFFWTLKHGQYDDLEGSAARILTDEDWPLPRGGQGSSEESNTAR